eukprot:c23341_g3_i1 orf=256-1335(+)
MDVLARCLPLLVLLLVASSIIAICHASKGDWDPGYRACVEQCVNTGCIGNVCYLNCKLPVNGADLESSYNRFLHDMLYFRWMEWDCPSECRYQCMMNRETERMNAGLQPIKYHGKWPFKRALSLQEPASVAFSVANFAMHLQGWISFLVLVYYKLPQRHQGKKSPYYEYTDIWIIYGLLSMNSWFWSAWFHSRDMDITEKLDYSSAVALIGYTLILAVIRTFNLRIEASRVMAAAPIIAFVTTHILYLNLYEFDYGLNMKVCVAMATIQLILWTCWGAISLHPARFKLWFIVIAGALAMLLEIYDFPPILGIYDAHSLWHALTIPLTYMWWSFIKEDATFRTSQQIIRAKETGNTKKVR